MRLGDTRLQSQHSGRQRQLNLCVFKVSLVYIMNSRITRAVQRVLSSSKRKKKRKEKRKKERKEGRKEERKRRKGERKKFPLENFKRYTNYFTK